ncbi:MAG: tRNA-dihydrouridine synthase family protein [Treponema sp.]|nr:tRNA-dihydrouridine synthase family protein [Treponema sp.]
MKFVSGPMATVSHRAFRNLIEKFGYCDEYFNEMINAGSLLTNNAFEKFYVDYLPSPQKLVWQLTGFNADKMTEAAAVLCSLPGLGLDLNMGCSAPEIVKSGAGISWMIKPIEETRQMVKSVRAVLNDENKKGVNSPKRFSVKLRLGDEDFTDEKFYNFTDMLVSEGVELLTLHPRTRKEKLVRPPRYHYAEDLKKRYGNKIKVYLNGNIKDKLSYENAIKNCPSVDGVMISRAAIQKPWIFKELKGFTSELDFEETALSFIDDVLKYQPEEFWKTRLQRFFTYYAMNFKFSHYAQTLWLNAENPDDLKKRIRLFFEKCPEEKRRIV